MQKSTKSELVHEMEKHLSSEDYTFFLAGDLHKPSRRYGPYEVGRHKKHHINFWRIIWKEIGHYKCDFASG